MIIPFERVSAPSHHARHSIGSVGVWHSWTPAARSLLAEWRKCPEFPDPILRHLRAGLPYDYTYSLDGSVSPQLLEATDELAEGYVELERPAHIILLTNLLDDPNDGIALHRLLACLRDRVAVLLGDPFGALYAPLSKTGPRAGAFALHADLYKPDMLMNVFDDVPQGRSGASLFLSVAKLLEILRGLPSVPPDVYERLESCLSKPVLDDRYEEFFSLLHGRRQPWSSELRVTLRTHQMKIKFFRGEGYLIHDRTWIHGRTAPRQGVSPRRLHRLIFRRFERESSGRNLID
jgi:hypothetical protein